MEGFQEFYWNSGRLREAETPLQAAAAAAAAAAAQGADDRATCLRVQVRALAWLSQFQRLTSQWDAARQLQQQCVAILQDPALAESDTRLERAILSWSMGFAFVTAADYAQGKQHTEESYSLFRELGNQWGMAWTLYGLGIQSRYRGDYEEARQRFEEGLAINRALGNQSGVAYHVSRLSRTAWRQGRFAEAERLAREGVATALEVGSRARPAFPLMNLGEVLEKVGKFTEARSLLQQSLELYTDLGRRNYISSAHTLLGSVTLHMGRYEEARDLAQTGLNLAREHGPWFYTGLSLLLLGCLELAQGTPATAHPLFEESAAFYREVGPKDDLGMAVACRAMAAHGLGDRPGARQHLCHALEIAQECGVVSPLIWTLPATALLLAGEGENERAVELYALASRFPLVAKSRWFADVAGNTLAEITDSLPANQVAILQERGRTRDLEASVAELLSELRK
jgi:tetratricopeptide (TPR) repeat protein